MPSAADRYLPRVVDTELDALLGDLPAVVLEGPKGVGKTATAARRATTLFALDDPATVEVLTADPGRVVEAAPPVLLDEWQRRPEFWDVVRRAVDAERRPGRFLLTGSATPSSAPTHSGAGRIVTMRVRPMTLPERGVCTPTVSLAEVLAGQRPNLSGRTGMRLEEYVHEILAGGFPGLRGGSGRGRRAALDGYIARIVESDIVEAGVTVRRPDALQRWMAAYAAATATVTTFDRIMAAATSGEGDKPAKTTTLGYRDALERIGILEPLPAWAPTLGHFSRLAQAPAHHLADPALAARLVGLEAAALLDGFGPTAVPRDGTFLGALFESLAVLEARVFAQAAEARVFHFRTRGGEREIDLIIERGDHRVLAVEVKLSRSVTDADVRHLRWLQERLGDRMLDALVLTTGEEAYRRPDGIGVVPLALLGP